jgi:hypothetical protein
MALFRGNHAFELEDLLRGAGVLFWPDKLNRAFPGLEEVPLERVSDVTTAPCVVAWVESTDLPVRDGRIVAVRTAWWISYHLEFPGGLGRLLTRHTLRREAPELSLCCLQALEQARAIFRKESKPLAGVSIRFME